MADAAVAAPPADGLPARAAGDLSGLTAAVHEPRSAPPDARTLALQATSNALVLRGWRDPKDDLARRARACSPAHNARRSPRPRAPHPGPPHRSPLPRRRRRVRSERRGASFDVRPLEVLLAGGAEAHALRLALSAALASDPLFSKASRYDWERAELYERTLASYLALSRKAAEAGTADPLAAAKLLRELLDEPCGLDLHVGMFIPTIQGQGDEQQRKAWLPLCYSLAVVGTYAQTELGHGTYLRGLETTATYDVEAGEWVLHSPTLSSTKWWPGGLGKTANHVICMARLVSRGVERGPHAFVVRIRDARTHAPLPGVAVGDIGPKLAYNAIDNGFLRRAAAREGDRERVGCRKKEGRMDGWKDGTMTGGTAH